MGFPERLKKLRSERDLRQSDLAKILDVDASTITKYENNKRKPDYEMVEKIADYFNVSVDYILGRTDLRSINVPKELIEGIKYAHKKGIPAEDIKVIIDVFEQIKPIIDKLEGN